MGVWPHASPNPLARRVNCWLMRSRSCGASSARRWRTEAVPCGSRVESTRARCGAVRAFGVPTRAFRRRQHAPRAL